ncbi:MAG: hxuB [Moraxellaceae bacterium]|nr:hxuB [Moraxellaceae bacterium]
MKKRYAIACAVMALAWGGAQAAELDPVLLDPATQERDRERREQRREAVERIEGAPKAEEAVEKVQAEPASGPRFLLRSVRFSKSEHLSEAQLRDVVQPWLGREISFDDLQKLVGDINALYRRQGIFTATAVLPKQKIENGEVLVRLIEGRLGKLVVTDTTWTDTTYVRSWMQQRDGAVLIDARQLESDILAFNRVNDQRLMAELRAGETFGLTDIVVRVEEPERRSLQLFVDNYNYESSGRNELGALYRHNQLWTTGDRVVAYAMLSEGMQVLGGSYNLPLGRSLWRVGSSVSLSATEVVEGDFAVLDVTGESFRINFDASRLVFSRPKYWGSFVATTGYTLSQTEIAGVGLSEYGNLNLDAGLQFNFLGSRWQFSARQVASQVRSQNELLDRKNDVLVWRGDLSSLYRFGNSGFSLLGQGDWQFTRDRALGGAVGYTVGGPASVRGYLPGAVSGDNGYSANLELHYNDTLADVPLDVFAFADHGYVRSLNPEQRLSAAGLGLRSNFWRGLSLETTAGRSFEEVVPYQDDWVYYARLSCQCL